jgi:hypothetical protein
MQSFAYFKENNVTTMNYLTMIQYYYSYLWMSYNSVMKLSVNLEDGNDTAVALTLGGQRPDLEPLRYCTVLVLYVRSTVR